MLALLNFIAFLIVTGYAVYAFAYIVYSRIKFITLGQKANLKQDLSKRINEVLINVFGQRKMFKDAKSGVMHFIMFYGFIILQFGAIEMIIKGFIKGFELPLGDAHRYFSLSQEITTFLVLVAALYAFYRRYIEKLPRLKRNFKSGLVIIFLTTLMCSIFLGLAFEKLWIGYSGGAYAPFSGIIAGLFSGIGATATGVLFYVFWWVHLLTLLSFLVYVPQSKHAHLLFAPVNVALRDTKLT